MSIADAAPKGWKKMMQAPVAMEVKNSGSLDSRKILLPNWEQTARDWDANRNQYNKRPKVDKRPLGTYRLFPSIDPYNGYQRALFRSVNKGISWVKRSNRLMAQVIAGYGFTTTIEPRNLKGDIKDQDAQQWAENTKMEVPWFKLFGEEEMQGEVSAMQVKQWIDDLGEDLQMTNNIYRAIIYSREQGISAVAMFPEERGLDERGQNTGMWQMPQVMRTIRPEHINKIWLNMDTGDMDSVQIIGVQSNGGRLAAERMIWMMNNYNTDVNTDYYGESDIEPILEAAKTMAILYAKDFPEAAQYTWHQPKVFQVTVPPRDYKNVTQVLGQFLRKANNSQGRDIAVTQSVELVSGQSNVGDIQGLINMDDHLIDQILGYYNIPAFLMAKGKAGNLGGDAQKEEIDGFLNIEVKPKQEIVETQWEEMFYDRILMILFQTEDLDAIPYRIRMHLAKPDIETLFNKDQYEVLLDMTQKGLISEDGMVKRLGVEHLRKESLASGTSTPTDRNVWPPKRRWWKLGRRWNMHWDLRPQGWSMPSDMNPAWNNRPQITLQPNTESKMPIK